MGTLYFTPADVWIHAAPPSLLFGDADQGIQGIDPGTISQPTRILGSGSGVVSARGIPRSAWTVLVRCVDGGEINTSDTVNPNTTGLPTFQFSVDAGVTYSAKTAVSAHRNIAQIEWSALGVRFEFRNGATAPSFVAGDVYSCVTTPSHDIIVGIPPVCRYMDKFLVGSFDLPLTEYPEDFTICGCDLLRWRLLRKIGVVERQDIALYKPIESWEFLKAAQEGDFIKARTSLGIVETPPGTSVQQFAIQPDLLRREFPI